MEADTWRRGAAACGAIAVILNLGCGGGGTAKPDTPATSAPDASRPPPPGTRSNTWPEIIGGGTDLFPRAADTSAGRDLARDPEPPHPPDAQVPLRSHRGDALDGGSETATPNRLP